MRECERGIREARVGQTRVEWLLRIVFWSSDVWWSSEASRFIYITDIKKPTNRDLITILNKNELLKVMKYKTLLENINKSYWFPIMRKIIVDSRVSKNPDEYMYDILWGESGSRRVRIRKELKKLRQEREKRENK